MKLEASYLAKEMVAIHSLMCPMYHKISPPMSLSRFKDGPLLYQVTAYLFMYVHYIVLLRQTKSRSAQTFIYHCMLFSNRVGAPGRYMEHLRAILDVMTRRLYDYMKQRCLLGLGQQRMEISVQRLQEQISVADTDLPSQ